VGFKIEVQVLGLGELVEGVKMGLSVPTTEPKEIINLHIKLMERLMELPEVLEAVGGEPASVGIKLLEPEVNLRLVLDGRRSRLEEMGKEEREDEVTITMKWETAHKFWLGKLNLTAALLTGKIKVEGRDMDALFRLKSIIPQACEEYIRLTEELKGG